MVAIFVVDMMNAVNQEPDTINVVNRKGRRGARAAAHHERIRSVAAAARGSDVGVTALAGAITSGALGSLKELWLAGNQVGHEGMKAFASAIASGALASINFIDLDDNKATETGKKQMRDVAQARGFRVDLA